MGIGDEIIATGMARGAFARGRRIAFGDGKRLIWGPWCNEAFKNNPNIAHRADLPSIEWIYYYKGRRGYNSWDRHRRRWIWNYDFKAKPGEIYFDLTEHEWLQPRPGTVLIEPNVPWHKPIAVNKDWGLIKYQQVADRLSRAGWHVIQTSYGEQRLRNVDVAQVKSFRHAVAVLAGCDLAIVPEGGLHHAAAAVNTSAIVIFGGCIPPEVLGYESQVNLTGNTLEACGSTLPCGHCRAALDRITVEEVYASADAILHQRSETASGRVA